MEEYNWNRAYEEWVSNGRLAEKERMYIREMYDYNSLELFLIEKVENSTTIAELLQHIAFLNYLFRLKSSIIGKLNNLISAIIQKLRQLAQTVGGVYFHIGYSITPSVSITFQINPIQTQ